MEKIISMIRKAINNKKQSKKLQLDAWELYESGLMFRPPPFKKPKI